MDCLFHLIKGERSGLDCLSHLNRKGVWRFKFFCELFAVVRLFRRATVDSIVTFRFRRLRRRLVILGYLGFALVA